VRFVKSSWICCVAASCALAAPARPAAPSRDAIELTNFRLSPDHSQWLVGAIAWMAEESEIQQYLALSDDQAAESFITEFWSRRSAPFPAEQPRAVFERRAVEADRRFSESARLGRRTDRGTIYVLYGEAEEVTFEMPTRPSRLRQEPIEVWAYPRDAEAGLDGEQPKRRYFFVKKDTVTTFSSPP
jgi:GWxTD domain-containing protein